MAMLPFFGYNVADYFQHWLEMERTSADATKLPKIYFVNWFRKGDDGRFMWPGFGDNSRVLKWICQRIEGAVKANETAIGNIPFAEDIDLANNDETAKFHVVKADLEEILKVDVEGWKKEIETIGASYDEYDAKPSKDSTRMTARIASRTQQIPFVSKNSAIATSFSHVFPETDLAGFRYRPVETGPSVICARRPPPAFPKTPRKQRNRPPPRWRRPVPSADAPTARARP